MTDKSVKEIEERVINLIQDSMRKGKITRNEGFELLQRITRELEDEIALASKN